MAKFGQVPYLGHMSEQTSSARVPRFTLADRLRKSREWAGLEQSELAERIGLGRTTIGNYERGVTPAKRPLLLSWAIATGVPLEWLRDGIEGNDGPGITASSTTPIQGYEAIVRPGFRRIATRLLAAA